LSRQGLAAAMIVHNLDAVGEMLVSADDIPVFTLPSQILAEMSKYSFALASFQRHEYSRYSTGTLEPRQMDETVATRVIQDWWRRMPSMEQSAVLDAPDTVESSFREDEAAAAIQVWWRQRLVEREVLYYEEYDSDSIDSYWSR
jgi:hypothetical protein